MTHTHRTIPRHPITRPSVIPFVTPKSTATASPTSPITPDTIKTAYSFPKGIDLSSIKIACIEAFSNDTLEHDLTAFCNHFGFSTQKIQIIYPFGKSRTVSSAWIYESALDVQWLCALCNNAQIYTVFSPTNEIDYMIRCATYAADTLSCDVVLMSFGTQEFLSQTEISNNLRNYPNTIFVSASGDTGGKVFFPSSASAVLSVGGCTAALSTSGQKLGTERAWRFGGGGPSKYEALPLYQHIFADIKTLSGDYRATPDVCFYSDFSPGIPIYTSSNVPIQSGWRNSGGTSFASVALASICAYIKKLSPEGFQSNINSYFYTLAGGTKYDTPQKYFNDITTGANVNFSAKVGWDFCTGLGSPKTMQLILG